MGEWASGAQAAVAGVAAWMTATATGRGEHVDVSMLEVMVRTYHPAGLLEAQLGIQWRGRYTQIPSVAPTADGWVGLFLMQRQHYVDLMHLIGRPDLAASDMWDMTARFAGRHGLLDAIHEWTRNNTTEQVVEICNAMRIPATNFGTGETIPHLEHFEATGVFVENPSGGFLQPRVPYRVGKGPERPIGLAPKLGETKFVDWEPVQSRPTESRPPDVLPLEGIRIVDLTSYWAGPECTDLLAALGADVIKVESPRRPDSLRLVNVARPDDQRWWEFNGFYHSVNRNKRSVTIDLAQPEGFDVATKLVATADVVIENMTPRVLGSLGLGWDVIHELNNRTILARMPAFGLQGPWRDRGGFGPTMEQVTGVASVTGYIPEEPIVSGGACDAVAGAHAAFAVLVAIEARGDGEGSLVGIPMVESVLNVAAEVVIEYSAYHHLLAPQGNRSLYACPQGIYRCVGDDDWVALSVIDESNWRGLLDMIGAPEWLRGEDLATVKARRTNEDRIDEIIASWAAGRTAAAAAAELVSHGVPAAPVTRTHDLESVDQLVARGFLEPVNHPLAGRMVHPGIAFRFVSRERPWIRRAPPTLGQHNREVLGSIGIDEAHLHELEESGVISQRLIQS
jgi:crotonobetainyl-CoA:carnitine CoA-transferase CaiB-like acyl-CoA transferase